MMKSKWTLFLLSFIYCGAVAQITVKNENVGIHEDNPTQDLVISPKDGGATTGLQFKSINTTAVINYFDGDNNGSRSQMNFNLLPKDNVGNATVSFFRTTNTTGNIVGLQLFKGDGSNLTNTFLSAKSNSYLNALDGFVGIGTASPSQKLDVNGNIRIPNNNYLLGTRSDDLVQQMIGYDPANNLVLNRNTILGGPSSSTLVGIGENSNFDIRNDHNQVLMRLRESDGFLGVGTLNPTSKLDVDGNVAIRSGFLTLGNNITTGNVAVKVGRHRQGVGHAYIDLTSDNNNYANYGARFIRWSSGATSLVHRGLNNFYIQSVEAAPIVFHINGSSIAAVRDFGFIPVSDNQSLLGSSTNRWSQVWSVEGVLQTSDRRLKENIKDISYGLSEVLRLDPVEFSWKKDSTRANNLGFIAQDLEKILPEVVTKKDDEYMAVNYAEIIPVLVNSIKEQQEIIDALRNTKGELEEDISSLHTKYDELYKLVRESLQSHNTSKVETP